MSDPGFVPRVATQRLEDWVLEHFVCPLNPEGWAWPAFRGACIATFVLMHAGEHGVPGSCIQNGILVPMPRCPVSPCRVCGVSYALLELYGHHGEEKSPDYLEILQIEEAAKLTKDKAVQRTLRDRAAAIRAELFSRTLRDAPGRGRPRLGLAHAVTQHLDSGGFTYEEMAELLDTTPEACRKRVCRGSDWRTTAPYAA